MERLETWVDDALSGFVARPLDGVPAATLVRPAVQAPDPHGAVLHVHGYNDYFFQRHLAEFFTGEHCAFYAVDMRRAGRSLRDGETPHYSTDLTEYGDDLDAAAAAIAAEHPGLPLVVHAHSTGALSVALWAADRPPASLAGIVMDSPFLAMPGSRRRQASFRIVPAIARRRPLAVLASAPSRYAHHLLRENGGRWDFDPAWKNPQGQPQLAGWLAAVLAAQARVARGLDIRVPVLVAHSDSSGPDLPDNPALDRQDTVLDVTSMERLAPRLGRHVTTAVIEGGVHELSLSAPGPRSDYLAHLTAWLKEVLA